MPAPPTGTEAGRAVEILGVLVASGDAGPYSVYAQLPEFGDAVAVDDALPGTVA
jgi:hypothetical protein